MRANRLFLLFAAGPLLVCGEDATPVYSSLKAFMLSESQARADHVVLKRDRIEMLFDGVFYSEAPVHGKVRGAVFLGIGSVKIDPPDVVYERDNLHRMLRADRVESDFKIAVLRFSDDTWEELALKQTGHEAVPDAATNRAREFSSQLLKETGLNPDARIAVSILNGESPGVFLAEFDKGRLGRFNVAFDYQGRIPSVFGLNAGEQGIVFSHHGAMGGNDIWLAFTSLESISQGRRYSPDFSDLLHIKHYSMKVDLREVKAGRMAVESTLEVEAIQDAVRAVPFNINEGLGEYNDERLKKGLRVEWVKALDGSQIPCAQEAWESGLTIFWPMPLARGTKLTFTVRVSGHAILRPGDADIQQFGYWADARVEDVFYPRSTASWYPTHGFLERATYNLVFLHKSAFRVTSIGSPYEPEGASAKGEAISGWKMDVPVSFATFAVGDFNRNVRAANQSGTPVEYYSPASAGKSKEDYMLTELSNDVGFFSQLFGPYPFRQVAAVFHPRSFGQGFPSLLLLAPTLKRTNMYEFAFLAHEMAHQWWGHVVSWKSYRDQWLSEGFAEYSGTLYVRARMNRDAQVDLVRTMRKRLLAPPVTETGVGKGRVADLGPIVLGLRASSPKTLNAYTSLVYWKGALVLRMLHFLLTHPGTGDDTAFYNMLKDFTARYAGRAATTEDFFTVASEHFRRSPLGMKYHMQNLDWFYQQWVLQAVLPSYRMEYTLEPQASGVVLKGVLYQDGAPGDWFMPLPLVIRLGKDQEMRGSVEVKGEKSSFSILLPARPSAVLLDPELYILSEKTEVVRSGG